MTTSTATPSPPAADKPSPRRSRLEDVLSGTGHRARAILEGCLEGQPLAVSEALELATLTGRDLHALCSTADEMRRRQVGDAVTYVVNRNVNFTNVCVKTCKFCAFSRGLRSEQAYLLDTEEVIRRVRQASDLGATEVCLQAGLAPSVRGRHYIDLCRAVKEAVPEVHIHAFSPEEVRYGVMRSGLSVRDYLLALKEAGLGSLPGTSAEILDDSLRQRISPGRIGTAQWVEVIETAHELGIPTTATMMYGHLETTEQWVRHVDLIRSIQRETGGFTEFVPLSFVHGEAPMYQRGLVEGVRPGPTGNEVLRVYAVSRLLLGPDLPNLQASWVKEGIRQAQWLLDCGANDLGGTLINESISTSAGASHGQLMSPADLRRTIRDAGRAPVQRDTLYRPLRTYPKEATEEPLEPLDAVDDADATFGSYASLAADARFRYRYEKAGSGVASTSSE